MKTIPFGKTGAQVSELCLGTMYFGTTVDVETSEAILDTYVEAGGGFLDTANKYACWIEGFAGGESETLLGEWMKKRGNRDQLFIATKMGLVMPPDVEKGLRAEQIIGECEKSLKRLGVETIDLYYAHADDRDTPMEESLRAFDSLVKDGKVRFLGASNYQTWRLQESIDCCKQNGLEPYRCIQMKHTCLQPRAGVPQEFVLQMSATEELIDFCAAHDWPLLGYSPALGGIYGRDDKPLPAAYDCNDNRARLANIRALANELGVDANTVAIACLMAESRINVIPVVGVSSVKQLESNLQALHLELTQTQVSQAITPAHS